MNPYERPCKSPCADPALPCSIDCVTVGEWDAANAAIRERQRLMESLSNSDQMGAAASVEEASEAFTVPNGEVPKGHNVVSAPISSHPMSTRNTYEYRIIRGGEVLEEYELLSEVTERYDQLQEAMDALGMKVEIYVQKRKTVTEKYGWELHELPEKKPMAGPSDSYCDGNFCDGTCWYEGDE